MTALHALRSWLERHERVSDAMLAALVLVASSLPLLRQQDYYPQSVPWWAFPLVAAQCLPLVWRRRWPFAVGLVCGSLAAVHGLTLLDDPPLAFPALIALYSVAAHASRQLSRLAAGIAATVILATLLLDAQNADAQDYAFNYLTFATAWLLGDGARVRRERAEALEARVAQAERVRESDAQRVVAQERTRIARELHDVVAHAVSLMVVQAEAGPVVVHRDPERAVGVFDSISATGKEALVEMRRLLGVLRTDPGDARAPQPGLGALPGLVARCRDAGLEVDLVVSGAPRALPPSVGLSAYRIVQEALTNTLRHAGPARAQVTVRYDDDAVRLEVTDDGAGASPGAGGEAGNGLVGMRERAAALGGTVTTGPGRRGGWAVSAELPLAAPVLAP